MTHLYHKTLEWRDIDLLNWKKTLPYALACIFLTTPAMFYYEEWAIQNMGIKECAECGYDMRTLPFWQQIELLFQEAMFYVCPWILTYHLGMVNKLLSTKKLEVLDAQNLMREAELDNLKNQLNPHFLFNSLNGIRSLIFEEPKKADEMITQLSELLRTSLTLGKKDLIPLSQELDLVSDYISLEKMRYEERLSFYKNIEENLDNIQIPPFIIQQLVENAIKHGTSQLENGGRIDLNCVKKEGNLEISVLNCALGLQSKSGTGLTNIRKRLALYFGDKASFGIVQIAESQVIAVVKIPLA